MDSGTERPAAAPAPTPPSPGSPATSEKALAPQQQQRKQRTYRYTRGQKNPTPASKRPGRRTSSNEELEKRYEFTAHLIAQRLTKGNVKRVLITQYGISARQCEDYITRARKLLVDVSQKDRLDHLNEAYHFYLSVFNNPNAQLRDKMWAQQRIDALFGLEKHVVVHQGDAANPVQHTHEVELVDSVQRIERVRQMIQRHAEWVKANAAAEPAREAALDGPDAGVEAPAGAE